MISADDDDDEVPHGTPRALSLFLNKSLIDVVENSMQARQDKPTH